MKLISFITGSADKPDCKIGVVLPDMETAVDLQLAHFFKHHTESPFFTDMSAFIENGNAAIFSALKIIEYAVSEGSPDAILRINNLALLPPVVRPLSIRDCMVFEKHVIQATRTAVKWKFPPLAALDSMAEKITGRPLIGAPGVWYDNPLYYKGNPLNIVGHDADVIWPRYSEKLDYELEFGIFIGKKGKNIKAEKAADYIAGYTIFNDFSARDTQLSEMKGRLGPAKGKDFDTGNSMGPYFITPDEIPDSANLNMIARINGEEWSRGNSKDMHYTFEEIIEYISRDETLHPGEFIASGTAGNGCGLELDKWLKPGDSVELEIEKLGKLRNRIVRP